MISCTIGWLGFAGMALSLIAGVIVGVFIRRDVETTQAEELKEWRETAAKLQLYTPKQWRQRLANRTMVRGSHG